MTPFPRSLKQAKSQLLEALSGYRGREATGRGGAWGPGDPGLVTLRSQRCWNSASSTHWSTFLSVDYSSTEGFKMLMVSEVP